jgi:hypothetical protein
MPGVIETKAALAAVRQIDEAVGILAKAVAGLKGQPDTAALKLAEALDEIGKTWQVMDQAITRFLALGFDVDELGKGSAVLLGIEGGTLLVSVQQGRGHCHIIGNIFRKYLDRWFQRVLKGDELDRLRGVFYRLDSADLDVFTHMEVVAEQLQVEANAALDSIARGKPAEARARILSLRSDLNPLRLSLSRSLVSLYSLKGEFIVIAGTA